MTLAPGFRRAAGALAAACLVLVATAYVLGPILAVWRSPTVAWWVHVGLVLLCVIAVLRPRYSPAVLLGVVPLLPLVPTLVPGVPAAIVHLVVLTQAIPMLLRRALARERPPGLVFLTGWSVFLVVCAVSAGVEFTPDRARAAALMDVWRDLRAQVPEYVFVSHATQDGRALPLLIALADGLLCALVVQQTVRRGDRRMVLVAAAVGALATALFGFLQAQTGFGLQAAWATFDPGIVRINATFVDPNALASYYALIGPVLLALGLQAHGRRRWAWAGAFAVIVIAMVMTAGRTGLLSLALASVLVVWFGLRCGLDAVDRSALVRRHARAVFRRGLWLAFAVVAVVVTAGTVLNVQHAQQTSYLHTWLYTLNLRQPPDAVAKGRIAVWQTVIGMVRETPLTGIGLGHAVAEFDRYRDDLGIASLPSNARLSAHNTFLLVTGELGLLGLAAWLLMLLTVIHGVRAPGNLPAGDRATWPVIGLAAGLVGLGVTMLTGDRILLREDIVIVTTCAALACVESGRLARWLRLACVAVVLIALVSWPIRVATRDDDTGPLPRPQGMHDPQVGVRGDTYRWSTGYAVIFLPAGSRSVTVPVRNLSPGVQRLRVFVDGRMADQRQLEPGVWETLTYSLTHVAPRGGWLRVSLEVTPTWQAPGDPRVLGVVVGEWQVEMPGRPADSLTDQPGP